MSAQILSQKTLKELLHYDPNTGVFTWKTTRSRIAKTGDVAGYLRKKDGYRQIVISGKSYLAHRLAFLYIDGAFPPGMSDHINHVRHDNKFSNLRHATSKTNNMNRSRGTNKSGTMGVYWHKQHQLWQANIRHNCKLVHLGYFENKQKAIAVRKAAEVMYGYHENHGKK